MIKILIYNQLLSTTLGLQIQVIFQILLKKVQISIVFWSEAMVAVLPFSLLTLACGFPLRRSLARHGLRPTRVPFASGFCRLSCRRCGVWRWAFLRPVWGWASSVAGDLTLAFALLVMCLALPGKSILNLLPLKLQTRVLFGASSKLESLNYIFQRNKSKFIYKQANLLLMSNPIFQSFSVSLQLGVGASQGSSEARRPKTPICQQ